ncbi:hypothetical protein [Streptomyces sp. NPDC002588]|uniref:hypothetical protein n=1 Tax=Streptomyces sp. NPDC002588 TaxID=3154419 RepID=UPI00331E972C
MPRMFKRAAVAVAASATLVLGLPAAPASALNEVRCTQSDFLYIYYTQIVGGYKVEAKRCWANAGEDDQIWVNDVTRLSSGNNAGYLYINEFTGVWFGKWADIDLLEGGVTFLHIN